MPLLQYIIESFYCISQVKNIGNNEYNIAMKEVRVLREQKHHRQKLLYSSGKNNEIVVKRYHQKITNRSRSEHNFEHNLT